MILCLDDEAHAILCWQSFISPITLWSLGILKLCSIFYWLRILDRLLLFVHTWFVLVRSMILIGLLYQRHILLALYALQHLLAIELMHIDSILIKLADLFNRRTLPNTLRIHAGGLSSTIRVIRQRCIMPLLFHICLLCLEVINTFEQLYLSWLLHKVWK